MASILDDRGFNQGFKPSRTLEIRNERRADYMISEMTIRPDTEILEIGCGTGDIARIISGKTKAKILAVDLCKPFIEEARSINGLPNLTFECLDFNDEKLFSEMTGGRKFDYIAGNGILHHLYQNISPSLSSIYGLLKKGGKIIFLEPNLFNPYCYLIFNFKIFRRLANLEPGEKAFSPGFIEEKLRKAGFKNIKVEFKDFLVPIVPEGLVPFVIAAGDIAERVPVLKLMSQSIFISAEK